MIELSVIIVNWNSRDYVRKCLASLFLHCRSVSFEVIVVDGASYDGCGEMLAAEFPSVRFLQLEKNVGFARANNAGVRCASGRLLLLLNPDTELHEDSIRILRDQLEVLPRSGAVGCRLVNTDGSLQTSCVQSFPTVLNQVLDSDYLRHRFPNWKMWGTAPLYAQPAGPAPVEAISGACMMISRETFDSVGGFTEEYFMYGEDLDLCCKIARSGRVVYYVPETTIVHFGGGSSDQAKSNFSNVMMKESVYRYLRLNRGFATAFAYRVAMASSSTIRLLLILILLPVSQGKVVRHGVGSVQKWFSILRWGLGLESWVRGYPLASS